MSQWMVPRKILNDDMVLPLKLQLIQIRWTKNRNRKQEKALKETNKMLPRKSMVSLRSTLKSEE